MDKYNDGLFFMQANLNGFPVSNDLEQSHRDNGHLFILRERGTTHIEIDFQKHKIDAPSIIYIHPNQYIVR